LLKPCSFEQHLIVGNVTFTRYGNTDDTWTLIAKINKKNPGIYFLPFFLALLSSSQSIRPTKVKKDRKHKPLPMN
jgi:hypothetical protein